MIRILARNVAANWVGFAVHAAVTFFLTPFVLSTLGDVRYGAYVLSVSLIGYYGLLDFGLRSGTTQYLTRYLAIKNYQKMNQTVSTVFVILALIGSLFAALSLLVGAIAPLIFQIPATVQTEVFWCVLIVGCGAGVQCALFPFLAVFTATQRYDIENAIGVATRLLSAAAAWWTLSNGHGLIGLSLAIAGVNLIDYAIRCVVAHRLLPQLKIDPRLASWEGCQEVVSFSLWNFLIAINTAVARYTDAVVIGIFLPISSVAIYALAASLIRNLYDGLAAARQVVYPAAAQLHSQNDVVALRRLYLDGSRMLLLATVVLAVIAAVWAEDFYRLWLGGHSLGVDGTAAVVLLFRILLGAMVLEFVSGSSGQILLGSGRIRVLSLIALSQALVNLTLSVVLVQFYGLVGIAIGTLVASLFHRSLLTTWLVSRQLSVPLRSFLLAVFPRPLIVGCLLAIVSLLIRRFDPPLTWMQLAVHGAIAAIVGGVLSVLIGTGADSRNLLLSKLFRRGSALRSTD